MCAAISHVRFTPESGHLDGVNRMTASYDVRRSFAPRPRRLVHGDARPGFAIQESFEVEAGKLIIRSLTNMRGECRECTGVARFQFGECLQITLCRGILVLFRPQRLEGTKGRLLAGSPEQSGDCW